MKEGWTYKKLGEVAKISSGKSIPSSEINSNFSDGLYPCFGGNGIRGYVNHYSYDGLYPIVGRVGALCGNVHLSQGRFYATEHALVVSLKTNDNPKYIEHTLTHLNLRDYAKGVAQPVLSASTLSAITIPIPPLAEQERIVAELDLLSSIIDKKKAQLKELDQLAQSIFYDMFGDPITNEKGWEVKKLGEACKLMAGGDAPKERFSKEKTKTYSVPVFSNGIENCGLYGYTDIPKITEKSITISGRGTIGFVAKRKEPFYPIIRLIVVTPIIDIDITYLEYYAISMHFDGNGVAIPQLTVPMIKNVLISLPPLPLQQEFASKIEAIERQKSLIQQSIVETQTLFDSRMQHWFN